MNNCQTCEYGAMKLGFRGGLYVFKQVIKKGKTINYDKSEYGCRMNKWDVKENKCIQNNFSEYKKFTIKKS